MVHDSSHEGLRLLLREEGISFQAVKTWKVSTDPDDEAKKRVLRSSTRSPPPKPNSGTDDPTVVICTDELGPLDLQLYPGAQWAAGAAG